MRPHFSSIFLSITGVLAASPSLTITLEPRFDTANNSLTSINCLLRLQGIQISHGSPLLTVNSQLYGGDAFSVKDDQGDLKLTYKASTGTDSQPTWMTTRKTSGDVLVNFEAVPLPEKEQTVNGSSRNGLRADQGGAIGQGGTFIPFPPGDAEWTMNVEWLIPEDAPDGTHVASSFGDRLNGTGYGVPSKTLSKAHFAVGPLRRVPSWDGGIEGQSDREFALYWIGSFSWDAEWVAAATKRLWIAIANFFNDMDSPYRFFSRRAQAGVGGAGGYNSFILEYSPGIETEYDEDTLTNLVAHETIHNYALMYPSRQYDNWYREGVANYYAVVAPFQGSAVDRAYLLRWLNNNAQGYYTSPSINFTWDYVLSNYWTQDAVKTAYNRGFIYLAQVQGLIAAATTDEMSLDDLVLELYDLYISGKTVQSAEFLAALVSIVGEDVANDSFNAMLNGTLILPPTDGFSKFGLTMVRKDAEKFDLGYKTQRVEGKISIVVTKASRAEAAGLRDGDEYVRSWGFWKAGDALENLMQVVVRRDGEEVTIEYWPRTYEKVENWMWVENNDDTI